MTAATARAANLASDNAAASSAYADGWQTGDNGGTGLGAWNLGVSINDVSRDGHFVGSSQGNGFSDGNIDTSGSAWGLYANGNNGIVNALAVGYRPFTGGALSIGQTLTLKMDNGFIDGSAPGMVGFALVTSDLVAGNALFSVLPNSSTRFEFLFTGGQSNYQIALGDGVGGFNTTDTGVGFTSAGLTVAFTLTGANSFSVSVNGGPAITGTLGGNASDALNGVAVFNYAAGSGSSNDAFFNSLAIVPEPSTALLVGAGLLGALALRKRRA